MLCLNFTNLVLYEQRSSRQFKAVFSAALVGIQALTDTLLPMHCGETIPTMPRLHKKVIMLFVFRGPDSDCSEEKGCISGSAGRATSAVKRALLLQVKVNSIFLILWTSQHEHISQMLITRGNKVSSAHTFPSNLWREHTSWWVHYTKFCYYHLPYLNDGCMVPEEKHTAVRYRGPDIFTAAFFTSNFRCNVCYYVFRKT